MSAKPKPPPGGASSSAAPAIDPAFLVDTLKSQLSLRTDEVLASKADNSSLLRRVEELTLALQESESSARDVAEEAARRAKEREASLQAQVRGLDAEVEKLRGQVALATEHVLETQRAYEAKLKAKGLECAALRSRMDDLAAEFGDMLQALLLKMQERVRLVEPSVEGGGGGDSAEGQSSILRAMKEVVQM